jgi:Arc/MetJ family transcription regulator
MRTTIRLDDDLLTSAKRAAAESGRTLTAVIEDALREALSRRAGSAGSPRVRLTTVGGNGPRPGVDLDDTAGLLELMDDSRGSA